MLLSSVKHKVAEREKINHIVAKRYAMKIRLGLRRFFVPETAISGTQGHSLLASLAKDFPEQVQKEAPPENPLVPPGVG